jgi:hypothetical protein
MYYIPARSIFESFCLLVFFLSSRLHAHMFFNLLGHHMLPVLHNKVNNPFSYAVLTYDVNILQTNNIEHFHRCSCLFCRI